MTRISVCMAIRNGERFLQEQLASILPQLAVDDEVIISDDHSTDASISIIEQFRDHRITVLRNPNKGIVSNFENALNAARGTFLFLADQDDVWKHNKVAVMLQHLARYDLVVSDCVVVDENLSPIMDSFHEFNSSGRGIIRNLVRNSYMGCCMAFHRRVCRRALPFPPGIPMHDGWIGMISEIYFSVKFLGDKLVLHRRHGANASTNGFGSRFGLGKRVHHRIRLVKEIIELTYAS